MILGTVQYPTKKTQVSKTQRLEILGTQKKKALNTKIFPFTTKAQYFAHPKKGNIISFTEFNAFNKDSFKNGEYFLDPTTFPDDLVSMSSIFFSLTKIIQADTTYAKLAYDTKKIALLIMILNSANSNFILKRLEERMGSQLPYTSNYLVQEIQTHIGLFCLFYIEILIPKEDKNYQYYPPYRNLCFTFRRKVYNYLSFHQITPKMFWDTTITLFKSFFDPDNVEYQLAYENSPFMLDLGPKIGHLAEHYSHYYITMRLKLKQKPTAKDMSLLYDDLVAFTETAFEEANDTTSIFCTHGVTFFYNYKIVNGVFKTRDDVDMEQTTNIRENVHKKKKDAQQVVSFYNKGDQIKASKTQIQVNLAKQPNNTTNFTTEKSRSPLKPKLKVLDEENKKERKP